MADDATGEQHIEPGGLLFSPSVRTADGGGASALALKPLEDGRLAMLLYTSLDRLVAGCGERQPWVALDEPLVEQAFDESGADVVVVDAYLDDAARWRDGAEPVLFEHYRQASVDRPGTGGDTGGSGGPEH